MENDNVKKEEETETRLTYTTKDFFLSTTSMHGEDLTSRLDILLPRKWMAAKVAGAFIYSVDNVETKILPGKYGIVSQINVNRKLMRRKPENVVDIQQPFNPDKFNFTKIQNKEILMNLQFLSEEPKEDSVLKRNVKEASVILEATLIINNAPICHTHSLLVPFLEKCQPQVLNHEGLTTAIHTVLLSKSTDLRIAFNSLGGFASVNHLHFHLYYFPYTLYTETAECERLAGPCYIFKDHFAPGFVFQLENGDVDQLASSVMAVVNVFLKEKVAHNLFITRGTPLETIHTKGGMYSTVRVVLWARDFAYGAKDVSLFATAVCELAGHVPIYSLDQWDTLSENDLLPLITSVCRDDYEAILPKVTDVFQPNGI